MTPFSQPKISVNLCTFNSEKYLKESIESILQQSFKDFELIVVDDGSTDSTVEILKSYQDTRIQLFCFEQNKGIVFARNYAISKSTGEYIAIMDHDDIANVDRLKIQYEYALANDLDVCASFYMQMFNQTAELKLSKQYTEDANLRALLTVYSPISDPTTLIRRSALGSDPYSKDDQYAQDYGLWCKLSGQGKKFGCCPENLLLYRVHATQVSLMNKNLAHITFKKIQHHYSKSMLGISWVPHSMKFFERLNRAFFYLIKLNKTIKNISYGVNYQIYARFQYRSNGWLTPFVRLERVVASLLGTIVGRF